MSTSQELDLITWEQVESSNISAVFFHEPSQTLCVRFNTGGLYSYIGPDHEIYMNLRMASSVGKYLNNVVKAFPYTRWETEQELLTHLNVK